MSESKVAFTLGDARIVSKVIEGAFPDYGRVIPRDNQRIMRVENKIFAQAVDRVAQARIYRVWNVPQFGSTELSHLQLVAQALGEHVFKFFLRNKAAEWETYRRQVTFFERQRYLAL